MPVKPKTQAQKDDVEDWSIDMDDYLFPIYDWMEERYKKEEEDHASKE